MTDEVDVKMVDVWRDRGVGERGTREIRNLGVARAPRGVCTRDAYFLRTGMGRGGKMKLEVHAIAILIVSCHAACNESDANIPRFSSNCIP